MESIKSALRSAVDTVREEKRLIAAVLGTQAASSLFWFYLYSRSKGGMKKTFLRWLQSSVAALPGVSGYVDAQKAKALEDIKQEFLKSGPSDPPVTTIPEHGMSKATIVEMLKRWGALDRKHWGSGKLSGTVYHGGDDLTEVILEGYSRFALSNPLHPDVFPSVRRMEAEVIAMCCEIFNGGEEAVGCVTAGGTESILMAVKTYRDLARARRGITEPELVVPVSAHAAFDKAAHYFGVAIKHVPVDPVTFKVDVEAMRKAVTKNTIMLVGSAVSFPQGVMDDIQALSDIALHPPGHSAPLPLHVDCCLGSFLIAFAERAGRKLPPFDFRVPGVTSISADTHKYGYGPKGASLVMYRNAEYRRYQYFVQPEWPGGIYATASMAGSRPGGIVAGTWAAMVKVGKDGYTEAAKKILACAQQVKAGIDGMAEIEVYGDVPLSVVAFGPVRGVPGGKPKTNVKLNIFAVGDAMSARGWNLNTLQNPGSIHLCVTYANAHMGEQFLKDLQEAVADVIAHPENYKDGKAAMYGMATAIEDKTQVTDIASGYLDAMAVTH